MQPELRSVLVDELMSEQNTCPVRSQRATPAYDDTEFRPFDIYSQKYCPRLLFDPDGSVFTDEHGPSVRRYLLPPGESTVHFGKFGIGFASGLKRLELATFHDTGITVHSAPEGFYVECFPEDNPHSHI